VLKLLKDKEAEIDKRGNYSAAELTEYISWSEADNPL